MIFVKTFLKKCENLLIMENFQNDLFYSRNELVLPGDVYVPKRATCTDEEFLVAVCLGFDPRQGYVHKVQRVYQGDDDCSFGEVVGRPDERISGIMRSDEVNVLFAAKQTDIARIGYDGVISPRKRLIRNLFEFAPVAVNITGYYRAEVSVTYFEEIGRTNSHFRFHMKCPRTQQKHRVMMGDERTAITMKEGIRSRSFSLDEFFRRDS